MCHFINGKIHFVLQFIWEPGISFFYLSKGVQLVLLPRHVLDKCSSVSTSHCSSLQDCRYAVKHKLGWWRWTLCRITRHFRPSTLCRVFPHNFLPPLKTRFKTQSSVLSGHQVHSPSCLCAPKVCRRLCKCVDAAADGRNCFILRERKREKTRLCVSV